MTDLPQRPNVLVILCDQLSAQAVGAYGNTHVQTPTMDQLAERGTRFGRAYTPYPLCRPARPAIWSSRWPHQTGVLSNGRWFKDELFPEDMATLGELCAAAGYQTVHAGKTHDHGSLRGFEIIQRQQKQVPAPAAFPYNPDTFHDVSLIEQIEQFFEDRSDDRPFLLVADVDNPHNICGWIGANAGPDQQLPLPDEPLPPLPENWDTPDIQDRPIPIQYICCSHRRGMQAAHWSEEKFRQYLAAYYHYCNLADRAVARILAALEASGQAENTIVVLSADHGDSMGAHRLVTKHTTFYEETVRVPLIFAGPGIIPGASADGPLVSLLDLTPTLLEIAGIEIPDSMRGRSLQPYLVGDAWDKPRLFVVSHWHTEWGSTIEPGRMVRSERYKYTRYIEGDGEELFDLQEDPGEIHNLAGSAEHAEILQAHRQMLADYVEQTGDPFFSLEPFAEPAYRSHKPGYVHHQGSCAPLVWIEQKPPID